MNAYDLWKQTDSDGERLEAEAEASDALIADAWAAMGFRERAELIGYANWRYRGQYGYDRKTFVREFVRERLSCEC